MELAKTQGPIFVDKCTCTQCKNWHIFIFLPGQIQFVVCIGNLADSLGVPADHAHILFHAPCALDNLMTESTLDFTPANFSSSASGDPALTSKHPLRKPISRMDCSERIHYASAMQTACLPCAEFERYSVRLLQLAGNQVVCVPSHKAQTAISNCARARKCQKKEKSTHAYSQTLRQACAVQENGAPSATHLAGKQLSLNMM